MTITSSAFIENATIPSVYTCDGDNYNPPLSFGGVPRDAKSLALVFEDPDVPKSIREDGMWNHWVVYNLPPDTQTIFENAAPPGTVGVGTGGLQTYQGPCPPDREHRYFFKLYALDSLIPSTQPLTKEELIQRMQGHLLASAELMGRYGRR
ncbi:MAG: YbhB/YbcL family Raf kinase inhibitor-like protein [Patescibacteria group bacterium]